MLTLHILNVYFDQTQPHQFKYTFNISAMYDFSSEKQQHTLLCRALEDILHSIIQTESYLLVSHLPDMCNGGDNGVELDDQSVRGTGSPKKQRFSHDQFHRGLRYA